MWAKPFKRYLYPPCPQAGTGGDHLWNTTIIDNARAFGNGEDLLSCYDNRWENDDHRQMVDENGCTVKVVGNGKNFAPLLQWSNNMVRTVSMNG